MKACASALLMCLSHPAHCCCAAQFERTLIIAEDNSQVSYLEGCTAPSYDTNQVPALCCSLSTQSYAPNARSMCCLHYLRCIHEGDHVEDVVHILSIRSGQALYHSRVTCFPASCFRKMTLCLDTGAVRACSCMRRWWS